MKHTQLFEDFLNEGKSFQFTIDYNTDEDDVEYIQNILMNAGVDAIAEPGTFDDEMIIKALNAVELRKAKKAIQADGFEINESFVNESSIGDIHIMAQEADSFTGFRKAFMDEYGKPKSVKELKSLEAWLQTIWNENQTNESVVNESNKFTASGFTFTIMGNQDSKGSYISFLPDGKTLDGYSKDEMANFIDSYFNNMDYFRDCMSWDKGHPAAGIVFRINANYLADSLLKEFKG